MGDVHKNVLSDFEFRENWRIESRNLLKRVRNFHPYFLNFFWIRFECNSVIMLWSICDFRGHQYVSCGLKLNCIYACNLKPCILYVKNSMIKSVFFHRLHYFKLCYLR